MLLKMGKYGGTGPALATWPHLAGAAQQLPLQRGNGVLVCHRPAVCCYLHIAAERQLPLIVMLR